MALIADVRFSIRRPFATHHYHMQNVAGILTGYKWLFYNYRARET